MVLLIDNYDSFTFNLVQYLLELGATVEVVRNDALDTDGVLALDPTHVVLSPGLESSLRGDVFVSGACAARNCGTRENTSLDRAIAKLSDHCPVLLDLYPPTLRR